MSEQTLALMFHNLSLVYDENMQEPEQINPQRTSREYLAAQQTQPISPTTNDTTTVDFDSQTESNAVPDEFSRYPTIEPQQSKIAPGMYRPMPEEEILSWVAPNRPFKPRSRRFFTTVVVIGLLVSLILFFAGQVLPVAVVFSIVFMVYMLSVVPPNQVTMRITTYGIHLDSELFMWEELGRFWFDAKFGQKMVVIETMRFPGRIMLLLNDQPEDLIETILSEVLLKERPPLTQFEKMGQWLEERIPLDID